MGSDRSMNRRGFVRLCASALALIGASPGVLAQPDARARRYPRARLVDAAGQPVTGADLVVGENYLFHYPFVATPCFLLNLGKPTVPTGLTTEDGHRYAWPGGVGAQRSIVAFSAICAHKMSHPARQVSFINYRHERVRFRDAAEHAVERAQVIYCCSEKSVYDPAEGARVLGGPAKQPLAAILLEEDSADGTLHAVGTYGGELFERFFREFGFRLSLEHRTRQVRDLVSDSTAVVKLTEYCQNRVLC
jgi:Rieske Fe-S protein